MHLFCLTFNLQAFIFIRQIEMLLKGQYSGAVSAVTSQKEGPGFQSCLPACVCQFPATVQRLGSLLPLDMFIRRSSLLMMTKEIMLEVDWEWCI